MFCFLHGTGRLLRRKAPGSDSAANSSAFICRFGNGRDYFFRDGNLPLSDVCEASENLSRKTCAVQPFDKVSSTPAPAKSPACLCRKISRQDLKHLPRRYWALANNSFLLHGYYAYHHLIYIDRNGKSSRCSWNLFPERTARRQIIWVPGIFQRISEHSGVRFR